MTDFTAKAPFNPEKHSDLHSRGSLPAAPAMTKKDWAQHLQGIGFGILGTFIFVAMAFQARAAWDSHREWVVAMTLPGGVIAGVCLGFLIYRKQYAAALPGISLLVFAMLVAAMNISRGMEIEGPDTERDVLSILTGVFLILSGHALLIAEVLVELKNPTKAPPPAV